MVKSFDPLDLILLIISIKNRFRMLNYFKENSLQKNTGSSSYTHTQLISRTLGSQS